MLSPTVASLGLIFGCLAAPLDQRHVRTERYVIPTLTGYSPTASATSRSTSPVLLKMSILLSVNPSQITKSVPPNGASRPKEGRPLCRVLLWRLIDE